MGGGGWVGVTKCQLLGMGLRKKSLRYPLVVTLEIRYCAAINGCTLTPRTRKGGRRTRTDGAVAEELSPVLHGRAFAGIQWRSAECVFLSSSSSCCSRGLGCPPSSVAMDCRRRASSARTVTRYGRVVQQSTLLLDAQSVLLKGAAFVPRCAGGQRRLQPIMSV